VAQLPRTQMSAPVAARESDDLDEVPTSRRGGRGSSREMSFVRKEEGSSVPEHSVDVEVGGHDGADTFSRQHGAASPARRCRHRAAETAAIASSTSPITGPRRTIGMLRSRAGGSPA